MTLSWQELRAKYHTDRSTLDPEAAAMVDEIEADIAAKRAAGLVAPPSTVAKQNFPIGLDDNFEPFPLKRKTPGRPNNEVSDDHPHE